MGQSDLGFAPEATENPVVLVAARTEHGVEHLGVLRVDRELPGTRDRPGLAVAREPHDDARQPLELLAEPYWPRSRRIGALEDPRVAVRDALQVRPDDAVPLRGARVILGCPPFADVLYDTTDSTANLSAFAHVIFDPEMGGLLDNVYGADSSFGVPVQAYA